MSSYCDQSTIELFRKLLKAGYADIHNLNDRANYQKIIKDNKIDVFQGSLISFILRNLYLHKLDSFIIKELMPVYNRGKRRRENPMYTKRYVLDDIEKKIC